MHRVLPLYFVTEDIAEERHKSCRTVGPHRLFRCGGFMLSGQCSCSAQSVSRLRISWSRRNSPACFLHCWYRNFPIAGTYVASTTLGVVQSERAACGAATSPLRLSWLAITAISRHSSTNCKFHDRMGDSVQGWTDHKNYWHQRWGLSLRSRHSSCCYCG